MKGKILVWLGLLGLVGLLVGCEEDRRFTRRYRPPKVRVKRPGRLTVQKPSITFIYSPIGKRDPFRPPGMDVEQTSSNTPKSPAQTETRTPQTELEKYELDQLKLVAVVTGIATPVAMVEDPKGRGHMVRLGTIIGKNRGRVSRIRRDAVIISQVYRDITGRRIVNLYPMRMKKSSKKLEGSLRVGGRRIYVDERGQVRSRSKRGGGEKIRRAPKIPKLRWYR